MKRLTMSVLFLGVAMCMNQSIAQKSAETTNQQTEWTIAAGTNGIAVEYTSVEMNGTEYLKIRFSNHTKAVKQISWTLTKGGGVIVNALSQVLDPKSEIEFFDASMLIPIENGDKFEDFNMMIK